MYYRITKGYEVHGIIRRSSVDIDKAKRTLDHLQVERQAQQGRLQLAAQAKSKLNKSITYSINIFKILHQL